jgi:cytochrome oxidase Cu insertion factor (SCO1/SenC/PrrC family)
VRIRRALLFVGPVLLLLASCERSAETDLEAPVPSKGDRAPGFTLPSASGDNVALSDFAGRKPVLLYFSMGPG